MIITEKFDNVKNTDEVFYDSSSVMYSKFDASNNELTVVFKGGGQYVYHDVDMAQDYMLFKHGGPDNSQGKALNRFIKSKYEYEKIGDADLVELSKKKEEIEKYQEAERKKNLTYFISGHRKLDESRFQKYRDEIYRALAYTDHQALFVVGDYEGCDIMAQDYLVDELGISPERITVYHMFDKPRNINPKITNTVGGFKTDEERDAAMTAASFKDIAFVENHMELSGTGMNILRRHLL